MSIYVRNDMVTKYENDVKLLHQIINMYFACIGRSHKNFVSISLIGEKSSIE